MPVRSATDPCVIWFDIETAGLDPQSDQIIQIAAIAVDRSGKTLEEFEIKIQFNPDRASPEALEVNSYDPDVWRSSAWPQDAAIKRFDSFLRKYRTRRLISKRTGKPYNVAQLAGHNIMGFDIPFVAHWFKNRGVFMPASFQGLDTLSLATWWREYQCGPDPKDLRLTTLAQIFGIDPAGAHDALADVRMNIQVAKEMLSKLGLNDMPFFLP